MLSKVATGRSTGRGQISGHFTKFLNSCGITVTVEGKMPRPGMGCVISHNETSFADVAAYFVHVWPCVDRLAGADVYAYIPYARKAFAKVAIELVPRGNRKGTEALVDRMVTAVGQGERLGWGGEGRLSGFDGVGRFKVGGSLIAIRAQVPVVPVVIHGGHQALRLGTSRACPGEIRIRFCDPVPTTGYNEADARTLADKLQAICASHYHEMAGREGGGGAFIA